MPGLEDLTNTMFQTYGLEGNQVPVTEHKKVRTSQTRCCTDVLHNLLEPNHNAQNNRDCTSQETQKLSMKKVIGKQFASLLILFIIALYGYVGLAENDVNFGIIFDCDPDSPTSIIQADGVVDDFSDEGVRFCYFKSIMIVLGFVFMFPFFLETFSIVTIIWVSSINDDVLIPLVDGSYMGYDDVFNQIMSANPIKRFFYAISTLIKVPRLIYRTARNSNAEISGFVLTLEIIWKFCLFMLPDVLLALALFPVSYFVLQTSDTKEDILVNLVAVQVFAQLDGMLVRMLFRPRSSVGDAIQNYVSENPNATRAEYNPMTVFLLNENRHQMGIDAPHMATMEQFHEYEGFHLVP